jgi:hypothetical protein
VYENIFLLRCPNKYNVYRKMDVNKNPMYEQLEEIKIR